MKEPYFKTITADKLKIGDEFRQPGQRNWRTVYKLFPTDHPEPESILVIIAECRQLHFRRSKELHIKTEN